MESFSYIVLSIWICVSAVLGLEPGSIGEFCRRDTFQAACPVGQVIVVDYAVYGQMHSGKCVPRDHDGCNADVLRVLDQECSGRRQCNMRVTDGRLMDANKCPDHVQPFLEVAYSCVSVISGKPFNMDCRDDGKIEIDDESFMTIPSSLVYSNRYGSNVCSWVIGGKPGQRVNVTIQDFGLLSLEQSYRNGMTTDCHKYATLVETHETEDGKKEEKTHDICGGPHREKSIYLSEGHKLEIQYPDPVHTGIQPNYLLKIAVLGCPDPDMNGNIFQDRDGDRLALYCESTEQTSYLHCRGRTWSNEAPFCRENKWPSAGKMSGLMFLGITVGTLAGLGCMGLCYCSWRCHRRRKMPGPAPHLLDECYSSASSRASSRSSPSDTAIVMKETAFAYGKSGPQLQLYQTPVYEKGVTFKLPVNGNQKPMFHKSTSNLYDHKKSVPTVVSGLPKPNSASKLFDPNSKDANKTYFASSWTRVNDDVVFIEGPLIAANSEQSAQGVQPVKPVQHVQGAHGGDGHASGCLYGHMMNADELPVYGKPNKSPTRVIYDKHPPNYTAAVHCKKPVSA